MAYNINLEQSIDALYEEKGVEKRKMFGGVGYKIHGNMCFGIIGENTILRLGQDRSDEIISSGTGKPFATPGRKPMKGWAMVDWNKVEFEELEKLLEESFSFASSLPSK
jgi:hypothetical protein